MRTTIRQHLYEIAFFLILSFGLIAIAQAQTDQTSENTPQKRVRVEVEITENGKTSTSIQELNLDRESINGQLDEMVEEIEMILNEAVQDVEETDLEITIRRNMIGSEEVSQDPHYRTYMSVIPEVPSSWSSEESRSAFLGVYATELSDERLETINKEKAVEIERVVQGSAADKAGLKVGDYVYEMGGNPIATFSDLSQEIKSHKPGEDLTISLLRGGEEMELVATLGQNSSNRFEWKPDTRAFLGVQGSDENGGAFVSTIIEGTAADESDLQQGDVILSVDGVKTESFEKLGQEIRSKQGGDQVEIEVLRAGEQQTLVVELKTRTEGYDVVWKDDGNAYNYNYNYSFEEEESQPDNRAFLGIVGANASDGIEITRVFEGSSAESMGLKTGDVIEQLDGKRVDDVDDLVEHLNGLEAGDDLKVTFKRDGKKLKESGTLGVRSSHCREIKEASNNGAYKVQKIVMHVEVEELDKAEIEDLNNKSGQNLDPSNSLELDDLQFSPNPNNGQFKLMFDLPQEGDTEIRVFDQNGQTIEVQQLKAFSGIYSNQFDISEAPAGVYFVSITQNGKGRTARVVKQ